MESVSRIKMPPAKPEFGNSPDDALVNLPIMPDAASNTAARVLVHGEPINASLDSLAYTLSQRRRYALLALFASTIAVDGQSPKTGSDHRMADLQSFVARGSSFSRA